MGGENLQELVKKQAKIISGQAKLIGRQAEANKKLQARIAGLEALARELQETIARLQKDSRNSSKPLSSDIAANGYKNYTLRVLWRKNGLLEIGL
jgi:molecular chaperone GrpE (heat shock protein)